MQVLPYSGGIENSSGPVVTVCETKPDVRPLPVISEELKYTKDSIPEIAPRATSTLFFDDFEDGNIADWTLGGASNDWEIGTPGGLGGEHGNPDPVGAYGGTYCIGNDLTGLGTYLGDYEASLATDSNWIYSPAIDCSQATNCELEFYRYLNVEEPSYDHAYIEVSNTGAWPGTVVWTNAATVADAAWGLVNYDISAIADNQATVYIRFEIGATDGSWLYSGWNIDEILVRGNIPDTIPIPLSAGWNLISIPVIQSDTGINSVLSSIAGQWECAMWYNATDPSPWESNSVYRPDSLDELWDIDHKIGVWLQVSGACTLNVNGIEPETTRIPLYAGWNLVGYPSQTTRSAIDTLPLDVVDMVAVANPSNPYLIEDTTDLASVSMEMGNGYWVHTTVDSYWDIVNTVAEPIRQTAEFERMQGVLIAYPQSVGLGIPYSLIAEISEDDIVYTIVETIADRNTLIIEYGDNGVNMPNCEWIIAPLNSFWTRDYGPWWITDENGDFGIVDFQYNRPSRPDDNDIPGEVASYFGVPLDYMSIDHTGGNYMTDGLGISVSTDLIIEENAGYTEAQIRQMHNDYLGIDTYHIVPDANYNFPSNTIKHIDCWAKYLDVDKIMIREVPPGHSQYDEIEAAVSYFESQTSAYGTPYQVYRVDTSNDEPYTNCLILNNKVLLPFMGSSLDNDANLSYQTAMPGYEVIGFTGSWLSTDALHCRARGIPDNGMLYIRHYPVNQPQPESTPIEITANITAYSMTALNTYDLYWKLSTEGSYNVLPMSHVTRDQYRTFIPGQSSGATIQYYIHAADDSGRSETNPFIGDADPHVFTIV